MSVKLTNRLNKILPRVTSEAFLSSEGIGKEIACYIFDYPAEEEFQDREYLDMMMGRFASHHSQLRVLHLNLLDVALALLTKRDLMDGAFKMEAAQGSAKVLDTLKGLLSAEKIRDFIATEHHPAEHVLFLVSGVGSIWPILWAHNLLNCLHTIMGQTPLVMFYPGKFDGTTLRLFGRIASGTSEPGTSPYYRAFFLVPEGAES